MNGLRITRYVVAATCVLGAVECGCSQPKGQVEGKVLYQGEPLHSGMVTFVGADGSEAFAPISPDGKYKISDLAVGEAKISVVSRPAVPEGLRNFREPPGPFAPGPAPPAEKVIEIPARYNHPNQSGLTYTVKSGSQKHQIELAP
jgi:hypothetical protein